MKNKQIFKLHLRQAGFTLIELIIVIAVIALLAAATFVAVNPAKRIGDANNAQRWSDATAIADAWNLYLADNSGTEATSTTSGVTYAITSTTVATIDLCTATNTSATLNIAALISGGYIGKLPTEPTWTYASEAGNSQYYFYTDSSSGVIKVGACEPYNSVDVEVIR